jgi:hypothetical protein
MIIYSVPSVRFMVVDILRFFNSLSRIENCHVTLKAMSIEMQYILQKVTFLMGLRLKGEALYSSYVALFYIERECLCKTEIGEREIYMLSKCM